MRVFRLAPLFGVVSVLCSGASKPQMSALYYACFDESRGFLAGLRNPPGRLNFASLALVLLLVVFVFFNIPFFIFFLAFEFR